MRFLALASFKAFEHAIQADQSAYEANLNLLIQALQCSKCALDIYEATKDGMSTQDQNPYGMALSNFTHGYIYDRFAEYLHNRRSAAVVQYNPQQEEYILGDVKTCKKKALNCYEEAYGQFKLVGHLMGTYLSKLSERNMYENDADSDDEDLEKLQQEQDFE